MANRTGGNRQIHGPHSRTTGPWLHGSADVKENENILIHIIKKKSLLNVRMSKSRINFSKSRILALSIPHSGWFSEPP